MSGTELHVPETMHIEPEPPAPPEEQRERPRSPHATMMEQIAKRYEDQQRGHEISYGEELTRDAEARYTAEHPDEAAEGEPEAAAVSSPERPSPPAATPSTEAAPQPSAAPAPRTISLQGQQFTVTEEQFQRLAETGALANLAMSQQPQQPQQPPPQQHVQQPQPRHDAPVLDPEEARAIVQRLSYGSSEDGVAAVQQLAENLARRVQSQHVDVAQISQHATQQALATIQFNNNLNQIGQEFPDVFNNQTRAYVAAIELAQLRQQDALLGRQRSDLELYREACSKVRVAMAPQQPQSGGEDGRTAAQAAPVVAVDPQRLAGKRAAPRNPAAVSRSAGLGPEAPRPPSASQIIDQMRKQRGQLPMN